MSWFFIALIAPALWSVTNYIDKYLIEKYFKGGGVGALLIFSSLVGVIVIPFILLVEQNVLNVSSSQVGLLIAGSIVLVTDFYLYLRALQNDEVSTVVPMLQMIPVFGFVLAYVFLGETLSVTQVTGALLIIIGAVAISLSLKEGRVRFKKVVFFLMMPAAFFGALAGLVFKSVALETGYWIATFWFYVGFIFIALFLLSFIRPYRKQFVEIIRVNRVPIIGLNALNELIAVGASLTFGFALLLAPLALVQAVNGFQPFFILLYGVILTLFFPHLGTESLARRNLIPKIMAIFIMFVGVYVMNS